MVLVAWGLSIVGDLPASVQGQRLENRVTFAGTSTPLFAVFFFFFFFFFLRRVGWLGFFFFFFFLDGRGWLD